MHNFFVSGNMKTVSQPLYPYSTIRRFENEVGSSARKTILVGCWMYLLEAVASPTQNQTGCTHSAFILHFFVERAVCFLTVCLPLGDGLLLGFILAAETESMFSVVTANN